MKSHLNSIIFNKRLLLLVIIAVPLTAAVCYLTVTNNKNAKLQENKSAYPADYRMKIEGLRFYGMNDGRKALAIVADSFVIEKKKVGFLTFSVAYSARLNYANIDFYSPALPDLPATRSSSAPSFRTALDKTTFADFPVSLSGISGLEVLPIKARFFAGDRLISQIQASSARIILSERSIIFSGNAHVLAGASELNTEQLSFLPEKGRLNVESPYTLRRAGAFTSGNRLTTDLQLKAISP